MPVFHENTYLFIDGEYLRRVHNDALQSVFNRDGELAFELVKHEARAQRVFVYDCLDDLRRAGESESAYEGRIATQESFFDGIRSLNGVHVRLGSLRGTPKRFRQKEVDVLLATDMLTHGYDGNMRQAILIAGDLDFRPIVEALVRRGYSSRFGTRRSRARASFRGLQTLAANSIFLHCTNGVPLHSGCGGLFLRLVARTGH